MAFRAGALLEFRSADARQLIFPEQGVLALRQPMGRRRVTAGLVVHGTALVLAEDELTSWQLLALADGQVQVLSVPLSELSICTDVLLPLQTKLMQQVAVWGHCRQHHSLPQRLATLLLLLLDHAAQWPWAQWAQLMDSAQEDVAAALKFLQDSGAIEVGGSCVSILQPTALAPQACACLARLKPLVRTCT